MIDQQLIDLNIKHCRYSLVKKQATTIADLYQLNNFFTNELVEKLLVYVNSYTNWKPVELQENLNRRSVTWDADTVFEETFMVFDQLTADLNNLFRNQLKLTGVQFWKDSPGYNIGMHVDNNRVGYSIQIYLTSGVPHLGTHFISDTTVEIPYAINTGYITSKAQQIKHGTVKPVPDNHTRYSVYAIWA